MEQTDPAAITTQALRNMLRARIQSADGALHRPGGPGDDDVHAARKDLKSARAILKLLRGVVGERRYSALNSCLRDAARPWAALRDSAALLKCAVDIRGSVKKRADRRIVADLVQSLRKERDVLRERRPTDMPSHSSALARADRTVARWPLDARAGALPAALESLYRKARKTFRKARWAPADEVLHEARKRAKYLMLALETLEALKVSPKTAATKLATAIGEDLGADHDLALIHPMLAARASTTRPSATVERLIAQRRVSLRRKAFSSAEALYARGTKAFVGMLEIR